MNKKEIKYLIPIMQAFVDGKTIQYYNGMKWIDLTGNQCSFQFPAMFRIKPKEPTYRPFKDAEECWTEMLKHQPFGWVKRTMKNGEIERRFMIGAILHWEFNKLFEACYCFADGTPFGIKVEE